MSVGLAYIFNAIRDRQILALPRKMMKKIDKLNPNKHLTYHDNIGHNTRECQDLLRQLWKLFEEGKVNEFVKPIQTNNQRNQ